jgi:putative membrane protein
MHAAAKKRLYYLQAHEGSDKRLLMSDLKDPRVLFAAERTLLAWNRTSLVLIAFGFVVERAGLLLKAIAPDGRLSGADKTAIFWLGLTFILLGAFTAAWSARQYATVLRTLNPLEIPAGYPTRWGIAVNILVALMAVVLISILYIGRN